MELVREILLAMEEHEHAWAPKLEIEGSSEEEIGFHVRLMGQAGLLDVAETTHTSSRTPTARPLSITWEGYEFLEAAREPSQWESAKKEIKKAGASMTFELLKTVLIALSKKALGFG